MSRQLIGHIEVFLAIVREGSLRAAARSLGVGAPTISHQLKQLEQTLGVDLIVRTTRSLELTEAGRSLLRGAGPAFDEIAEAVRHTRAVGASATGSLRLTMPMSAYQLLVAPMMREFQARYPGIRLEISIDESLVDVVREGFHAGFRLGDRVSSGMVARRLTDELEPCYFASSDYLEIHGIPKHPRDLLKHHCIRYRYVTSNRVQEFQFRENGQVKTVDAPETVILDSMDGVRQAVRAGVGIGWGLRAMIEAELASGKLQTVLDPFVVNTQPYFLFYPEQNERYRPLALFRETLTEARAVDQTSVF